MIKRYRWVISGIFVAVAFCFTFLFLLSRQSPDQEPTQWFEVKYIPIEKRLDLVGKLQSGRLETIPTPFDAIIAQVLVKEGQKVTAGQILVTLDTRKLDMDLRQAKVEMIKASSVVDQLHNWESGQEVIRARRNVENANHMAMESKNMLAKAQTLFSRGIIPKMEVETLEQQVRRQLMELASAQEDLTSIRQKGNASNVQVAEMELQNVTSRYQALQEQYAHKEIRAPFSGVVLRTTQGENGRIVILQPGVKITEGMALLEIMDTAQYQVLAQVEESDLSKLKEGQTVKISGEGFANHVLDGEIETIAMQSVSTGAPGSGIYYDIVIKVISSMNKEYFIRPGMSAKVNIVTYRNGQGMVIPEKALTHHSGGQLTVSWRPNLKYPAVDRLVTVGETMPEGIETHGLEAGFIAIHR
ncbi:HlyD family secretion protein [Photorhabdus viridis]|uniref:HlyD family secretion protein n=1 Tax=Photorhabdus viridis TaxID=3163327 RepID=UPI0033072633